MRIKKYFDMKKYTRTLLPKRGVRQLRNGLLNLKKKKCVHLLWNKSMDFTRDIYLS